MILRGSDRDEDLHFNKLITTPKWVKIFSTGWRLSTAQYKRSQWFELRMGHAVQLAGKHFEQRRPQPAKNIFDARGEIRTEKFSHGRMVLSQSVNRLKLVVLLCSWYSPDCFQGKAKETADTRSNKRPIYGFPERGGAP